MLEVEEVVPSVSSIELHFCLILFLPSHFQPTFIPIHPLFADALYS